MDSSQEDEIPERTTHMPSPMNFPSVHPTVHLHSIPRKIIRFPFVLRYSSESLEFSEFNGQPYHPPPSLEKTNVNLSRCMTVMQNLGAAPIKSGAQWAKERDGNAELAVIAICPLHTTSMVVSPPVESYYVQKFYYVCDAVL